ncbi:hypothetical protein HYD88_00780 [Mycoplasmopsis bovis]|nr:hypothetical protein HYD88_00780 [Mycoplasmopsis bovis]
MIKNIVIQWYACLKRIKCDKYKFNLSLCNWWNELRWNITKSNPKPIKITLAVET